MKERSLERFVPVLWKFDGGQREENNFNMVGRGGQNPLDLTNLICPAPIWAVFVSIFAGSSWNSPILSGLVRASGLLLKKNRIPDSTRPTHMLKS